MRVGKAETAGVRKAMNALALAIRARALAFRNRMAQSMLKQKSFGKTLMTYFG
jgi:hypothetical protein